MSEDLIPARDEPEWVAELEDMLESGEQPVLELPPAAGDWTVQTQADAEMVMRHLVALTRRRKALTDQAAAWREPIDDWERDGLKRIDPGIEFWRAHLVRFARWYRATHPKEATIRVPSGSIATRKAPAPKVEVVDDEAILAWALENLTTDQYEQAVKTEPQIRLTEFRGLLEVKPIEKPFCEECGASIQTAAPAGWEHVDAADDDDHPARPVPGFEVLLAATGVEVPGVSVVPGELGVTVKPNL